MLNVLLFMLKWIGIGILMVNIGAMLGILAFRILVRHESKHAESKSIEESAENAVVVGNTVIVDLTDGESQAATDTLFETCSKWASQVLKMMRTLTWKNILINVAVRLLWPIGMLITGLGAFLQCCDVYGIFDD